MRTRSRLHIEPEVRQRRILGEEVGHVDPDPVDATVEPGGENRLESRPHVLVLPREVGLGGVEQVEVPLRGDEPVIWHPRPGGAAKQALPVVGRLLAPWAASVADHVHRSRCRIARGRQSPHEPRVRRRGVVGDDVDHDPDPQGMGVPHEGQGVLERPERRVDVQVVGHVITAVGHRRRVPRRDPDRIDAEAAQIGQPRSDARDVAHAVAVRISEAADVDLVDDGGPPPLVGGRPVSGGIDHVVPASLSGSCPATLRGRAASGAAGTAQMARGPTGQPA